MPSYTKKLQRSWRESNFLRARGFLCWIHTTWRSVSLCLLSLLVLFSLQMFVDVVRHCERITRLFLTVMAVLWLVIFSFANNRNMGNNIFPRLPKSGLSRILHLKTFNNPKLRELPPPSTFPRIQVNDVNNICSLWLTENGYPKQLPYSDIFVWKIK